MMNTMNKTKPFLKTIWFLCAAIIFLASPCYATNFDLVLQWDENTEPDLATGNSPRYKIYYKTGTSGAGLKTNYIGQPVGEPDVADAGSSPVPVTVALDENPDPAIVQFTLRNLEDSKNYYIAVTALDLAGNESDLSNEVFYQGVTAPINQVPVVSSLLVNGAANSNFVYTNNSTGTVSVRIAASDVDGTVNQYLIQDNNSNPANGIFVSIPAGALANQDFTVNFQLSGNGTHTLYVWVKDNSGGISTVASKSNVVLDRTVPIAPTAMDLSASDDTGISSTDNITNRTSGLTISGSGEEGATVQLYNGQTAVGSPVVVSSGVFTLDISLVQGTHSITARQTDKAGNVSANSTPLTIIVDTTRPTGSLGYNPLDSSHVDVGQFTITGTFSESLGQAPRIAVTGSGPMAFTAQAMTGSGSIWTKTLSIPWNDNTAYSLTISGIEDVAGNTASSNIVGNFVTDTVDTDDDLIRDYVDPDDDNDGMPDTWELQYGLNPKVNDAELDGDRDGISNLNEYLTQTNPTQPDANVRPDMPVLVSPANDAVVSLAPKLIIGEFSDYDTEDSHTQTEWQIYLEVDGEGDCVYELKTSSVLTVLSVPSLVLDANTNYTWRARVLDDHGAASEWSEYGYFTTDQDAADADGDGIIDVQVPASSTDINQDGTPDAEQLSIKSIKVKGKASLIGMDTSNSPKVVKVVYLQSTDPLDTSKYPGMASLPGSMPYGLIDFKIKVQKPGDFAELTIYFSETLPSDAAWYKYDSVNNTWSDFSEHITINTNKNSMTLSLQDGGLGDSDGLANGMIVDPSGLVVPSSQDGDDPPSTSAASGGGGGGCFIQSVQPGSGNSFTWVIQWAWISGILMLIQTGIRMRTSAKRS
ncbi:MAG: hypothetical protein FP816_01005 [Desulfobacteraceae bacterium]|nr:hypothetical protein [Desulfobacteraceae bacterium]